MHLHIVTFQCRTAESIFSQITKIFPKLLLFGWQIQDKKGILSELFDFWDHLTGNILLFCENVLLYIWVFILIFWYLFICMYFFQVLLREWEKVVFNIHPDFVLRVCKGEKISVKYVWSIFFLLVLWRTWILTNIIFQSIFVFEVGFLATLLSAFTTLYWGSNIQEYYIKNLRVWLDSERLDLH